MPVYVPGLCERDDAAAGGDVVVVAEGVGVGASLVVAGGVGDVVVVGAEVVVG